ncbi:PTB domain-containing engulfment adapter protein 1 isoform X3 [Rhinoraja longicauda]
MNRAFSRKKDKTWMHSPEALTKHFIPYNVKFLGNAEVEQPKGTEIVKNAVRKLKAEEITLTIGQAFDLAYKKFLETGGKDVETRKQIASLQKRIQELETENSELKKKVQELDMKVNVSQTSSPHQLHISSRDQLQLYQSPSTLFWSHNMERVLFPEIASLTLSPTSPSGSSLTESLLTSPSPKSSSQQTLNGFSIPRPHGVMAPQSPSTDLFDMVPFSPASPLLPIPSSNGTELPPLPVRSSEAKKDIFGAEPFDPFISVGGDFPPDIQSKLDEMQEGFKMGLTLEGTVFSLDPLDDRC